ncbi:hypothetical protein ISG33_02210 [Glaciecola sp. MH2013]|uniref:DUF6170 family protein n=1 Tax=Glaciecola sp. MH2013 TaxID=2785524 RepID=UPI00189C7F2D|nr:DUF6170 family protein [Glaciecola sp. MH2013]MBF7072214.1 hypothetical protein [Glaciecola sp. MH2013]
MKIYTSTKHIPQLKDKPLTERIAIMEDAAKHMSVPEKAMLNVLKLLVLVPVFIFLLRISTDWTSLIWAALILALYPILVKPIQYSLCVKHLTGPSE